jgi:hypothetical protein
VTDEPVFYTRWHHGDVIEFSFEHVMEGKQNNE